MVVFKAVDLLEGVAEIDVERGGIAGADAEADAEAGVVVITDIVRAAERGHREEVGDATERDGGVDDAGGVAVVARDIADANMVIGTTEGVEDVTASGMRRGGEEGGGEEEGEQFFHITICVGRACRFINTKIIQ